MVEPKIVEVVMADGRKARAFSRSILPKILNEASVCRHCGDHPDMSAHGRAYNLGLMDDGAIGGQGPCGDCHLWV